MLHFVWQINRNDCGPAALMMVTEYYGKECTVEEPNNPVTVSDFSSIIQTYNNVDFATSIVEILISANNQSNLENTTERISSQLSTIYGELTLRGYNSMNSLTSDISLDSSMCYIYFNRLENGLNVYTYNFHI